jgi:hypothetical protein
MPVVRIVSLGLVLATALFAGFRRIPGQDVGRPGSTLQGDALRGQGQFLKGMAWYELGAAQARAIDVQTMTAWNQAVQAGYQAYLLDRATRAAAKMELRNRRQADVARRLAETQRRWRENPTVDDIRSGLALNALVIDLADPRIPPSSWRLATVELPPGVSLQSLVFRLASRAGYRLPAGSGPGVVALGRMRVADRWPVALRRDELAAERTAYQHAVADLVDLCAHGKRLRAAHVENVRNAHARLKDKAEQVIPAGGGLHKQAAAFLGQLDEATKIMLDHDFAEELIRDLEQHKARTVEQLLGFMKKYQLLLDEAGEDPAVWNVYQRLYDLLKKQKLALEFATRAEPEGGEPRADHGGP